MARLVQTIDTSQFPSPSPDPAGIVYIESGGFFLISDSEVNETPIFEGNNLFQIDFNGNVSNSGNVLDFSTEPTGLTYDPGIGRIFISDDATRRITGFRAGADGIFGTADDPQARTFSTRPFGSQDPEDLAYNPNTGNMFIADGQDGRIYEVDTDTAELISSFSTVTFGLSDPEGLTFDPDSGNLFIIGEPVNTVFEVSTSGTLIQTIDISAANPVQPAGLDIAPTSDDSSTRSLYIVDRGIDESVDPNENDGRLYEFALDSNGGEPGVEPEISITDASIVEGDSGNDTLEFTVSLSEASSEEITVDFTTNDDTAIAGEDYLASNGTITFATNETSQTISIDIIGDTIVETPEVETFLVNLSNASNATILDGEATGTITDNDEDGNPGGGGGESFYAAFRDTVTVGGNSFDDEDIAFYDGDDGTWSMYLDGSDLGIADRDLDGIHVNDDGSVLLSLNQDGNVDGLGFVDDADIIRFVPTSTGENTAGTFERYFDGSDVGLNVNSEDIDGISLASNGDILISTNGSYNVDGLSGEDHDILAFSPSILGENTSGLFSLYFDGSDVGLNDGSSEDIKGVSILDNGDVVLSTLGNFQVSGASGSGSDLFSFSPDSVGDDTSGSFSIFSAGADNGLGSQVIGDISVV